MNNSVEIRQKIKIEFLETDGTHKFSLNVFS
jgi:hypothetical protein